MIIGSGYQPKSGAKAPDETPRGGSGGSKQEKIRYLGDVQRLSMEPGDILVISVDGLISAEAARRIKADASKVIGENCKILVLDSSMKLGILTPAE